MGVNDSKFNILKKGFPRLKLTARGSQLKVAGNDDEIKRLKEKINQIIDHIERYGNIDNAALEDMVQAEDFAPDDIREIPPQNGTEDNDVLVYGHNGRIVKARTANQKRMVQMSDTNDIVFATGPAGTGKTYTAVALAVRALKAKQVNRIILTRPAVEAGENLGFLPGDLKEKIDPYLRPLYDALDDMIQPDKLKYYMETRTIEVAPLAFMRGRTLDRAFIILDEAQNATVPQLKMFLTRIGPSAKCIITGDPTQVDLPWNQPSGLNVALRLLQNIDGIGTLQLTEEDVIRHRLVKRIILAYNHYYEEQKEEKEKAKRKNKNEGDPKDA